MKNKTQNCSFSKRTGTSAIGFNGVTSAPKGTTHFDADWRSSGQQLKEKRTPSRFSRSDHVVAISFIVFSRWSSLFPFCRLVMSVHTARGLSGKCSRHHETLNLQKMPNLQIFSACTRDKIYIRNMTSNNSEH